MIAADVMTENPRTILDSDPVSDALEVLSTLEIRHLPVVDAYNSLVGMLSDRDLGSVVQHYDAAAHRSVTEYMSAAVVSVEEDSDLREVIETLLEQRIGAVPVVDGDGKVTGIISYVDLLRTYAAELEPGAKKAARATKKTASKKRAAAKKAVAKKAAAKRPAAKRPAVKKTAAKKKAATKRPAAKRPAAKKSASRKASAKATSRPAKKAGKGSKRSR